MFHFRLQKVQKFIKLKIQSLWMYLNGSFCTSKILRNWFHSRKIWVIGKSWNFHTVVPNPHSASWFLLSTSFQVTPFSIQWHPEIVEKVCTLTNLAWCYKMYSANNLFSECDYPYSKLTLFSLQRPKGFT